MQILISPWLCCSWTPIKCAQSKTSLVWHRKEVLSTSRRRVGRGIGGEHGGGALRLGPAKGLILFDRSGVDLITSAEAKWRMRAGSSADQYVVPPAMNRTAPPPPPPATSTSSTSSPEVPRSLLVSIASNEDDEAVHLICSEP